ncbi:MAG: RHS repeat-associated core domain-containing protein, partial [Acidobacteriota bacterium]
RQTWSDFDVRGRALRETTFLPAAGGSPSSYATTFEYDGLDRRTAVIDGLLNRRELAYDVRGNVLRETAPGSFVTAYAYDGLDRLTQATRPSGIAVSYDYVDGVDASEVRYVDAKNQVTTSAYDGLGRLKTRTYPDGTSEAFAYDAAGNATGLTLADGTTLAQTYDDIGRLTQRLIAPAAGLGGHTTESFGYDAVHRMTSSDLQGLHTAYAYDGLSRLKSETTLGRSVAMAYDPAGQRTGLTMPSGTQLSRAWTELGQLDALQASGGSSAAVAYDWQGAMAFGKRLSSSTGQETVTGAWTRDAAQRVETSSFESAADAKLLEEWIGRDGRGLITSHSYGDRGRQGWIREYDAAGRLVEQTASRFSSTGQAEGAAAQWTSNGTGFTFTFDAAENLLQQDVELSCGEKTIDTPLDGSGRNRPGSVDGVPLAYDANGYLIEKGDLHFTYDYRGLLVEVRRETSPGTFETVAAYGYDASNRRVTRAVGGQTWHTVWEGWQAVEEYLVEPDGDVLMSRRVYGADIDEVIGLQVRPTPASADLVGYTPIYDQVGNLVVLADDTGEPVERYDYSPFGERFIWSDSTPPAVEQVLFQDGQLVLELTEEVLPEKLAAALASGSLSLTNITKGLEIGLTLSYPVTSGRNARHRLVFDLAPPAAPSDRESGDQLQLTLPSSAFVDFFDNAMPVDPVIPSFAWQPAGLAVVLDTAAPELLDACLVGTKLRLELSETPDLALAAAAFHLNGAEIAWTLLADGYTLESTSAIAGGDHTLSFTGTPLDLAGTAMATGQLDFTGNTGPIWSAPLPGEIGVIPGEYAARSAAGNPFGFKGLPIDLETGFYYVRHRYYDPETGRFITPDPLGYVDGPSMYQFALNSPVNYRDPLGLESAEIRSRQKAYQQLGVDSLEVDKAQAESVAAALGRSARFGAIELTAANEAILRSPLTFSDSIRSLARAPSRILDCVAYIEYCGPDIWDKVRSFDARRELRAFVDAPLDQHAEAWGAALGNAALNGVAIRVQAALPAAPTAITTQVNLADKIASRTLTRDEWNEFYRDLRLAAREGAEAVRRLPSRQRGPVVSVVLDARTGQSFYANNALVLPENLHPLLDSRLNTLLREGDFQALRSQADSLGNWVHSTPGAHAEIHALNQALWAREAAGVAISLDEIFMANRWLSRGAGPVPRCGYCEPLSAGVNALTD